MYRKRLTILPGRMFVLAATLLTWNIASVSASSQETGAESTSASVATETVAPASKPLPDLEKPWIRLGKGKNKVWINQKTKQVAVSGEVCLTKGYLEMFACILGTKEHESVIALHSQAFIIHTGLLAVGAEPGSPARWRPKYQPAQGPKVQLDVEWIDQAGALKKMNAKQWIRDLKTKKAMEHDWVFAGSLFWVDPETKKKFYRAEGGEVACLSNFPVSMLDLPIESTSSNEELAFEVLTENVPKRRTPIRLYLTPEPSKKEK